MQWPAVSRFLVVARLLTGCATAPPANVRITPGVPPETARLRSRPETKFRPGEPGLFALGVGSPRDGLLYIPHQNECMDEEGLEANYIAGTPYVGANVRFKPGPGGHRGELTAWDPVKAEPKWKMAP